MKTLNSDLRPNKTVSVKLQVGNYDGHFNCAIFKHRDKLLLATRKNASELTKSVIFIHELDDNLQPKRSKQLNIDYPGHSAYEDPRLFIYKDKLYCSVTAVNWATTPNYTPSLLLVQLSDDYDVEEQVLPNFVSRQQQEKNWAFFVHEDQLFSVYMIQPHAILKHDGDVAKLYSLTKCSIPGDFLKRGGAAPIRVGDEYYHFYHSLYRENRNEYRCELYTFKAKPPFEISRVARQPIITCKLTNKSSNPYICKCVFPCGAMLDNDMWYISYGHNDERCKINIIDAKKIEATLERV